jgi:hypothetical protein
MVMAIPWQVFLNTISRLCLCLSSRVVHMNSLVAVESYVSTITKFTLTCLISN